MSKDILWSRLGRSDDDTEHGSAIFLRINTVMRVTGLGRSTIYRLMADDKFPHPVKLTPRVVAWRRVDLESWGEAQPLSTH
jgi:prophage regulatory protein